MFHPYFLPHAPGWWTDGGGRSLTVPPGWGLEADGWGVNEVYLFSMTEGAAADTASVHLTDL